MKAYLSEWVIVCGILLVGFLSVGAQADDPPVNNNMTLLDFSVVPSGYVMISIKDLNDQNQMCGSFEDWNIDSRVLRAFFWDGPTFTNLGNTMISDPSDADMHGSYANALNNQGQVVGEAENNEDFEHGFRWTATEGMIDLELPGINDRPYCISDNGCIGGTLITDLGDLEGHVHSSEGFLWYNGALTQIPTFGGRYCVIESINRDGAAVGYSDLYSVFHRAIIVENGEVSQLPLPVGSSEYTQSMAYQINDSGQICGWVTGFGNSCEYFWADKETLPIHIGTLGGEDTTIKDMNNRGQIIGYSEIDPDSNEKHPFLWQNGVMMDLTKMDLLPDGWELSSVLLINNNGVALAYGKYSYVGYYYFLLDLDGVCRITNGSGTLSHQPTGFTDGGYGTGGMPSGATALDLLVELQDPDLNDAGYVTLQVDYELAAVTGFGLNETSLVLYAAVDQSWWVSAGRSSNNDTTTGQFVEGAPTTNKGDWGIDTSTHIVWANVDHGGTFAIAGTAAETPVAGDVNGDSKVDLEDLAILAQNWLGSDKARSEGNLNEDASVNLDDFNELAENWLFGTATPVAGDVNGDSEIDLEDLVILAQNWLGSDKARSEGNLNEDASVNLDDFNELAENWLSAQD